MFANNRNFLNSLIFKSVSKSLVETNPYFFGLYNFPFNNAFSFFWTDILRTILLKNQFISKLRKDRIFGHEFDFNILRYKRISFLDFEFRYSGIGLYVDRYFRQYHRHYYGPKIYKKVQRYFYPFTNWFVFELWNNNRFRKYGFRYFKSFRIFFDSTSRIPIFFDRNDDSYYFRYKIRGDAYFTGARRRRKKKTFTFKNGNLSFK